MLSKPVSLRTRQQGVTLVIALMILVMITLASVALIRSMDTTSLIAGNMAFQQSAAQSSDQGVNAAVTWLEQNNTGVALFASQNTAGLGTCNGYTARREDPAAGVSWDAWWSALAFCQKVDLPTDAAGNTVSYTIHRMCQNEGDPTSTTIIPLARCSVSPTITQEDTSGSRTAQAVQLNSNAQIYYRITARIIGPRWTKTYIQAIVAL